MTAFGIYLVILYGVSLPCYLYYIVRGEGYSLTHGQTVFAFVWAILNLIGLLLWGTGLGL